MIILVPTTIQLAICKSKALSQIPVIIEGRRRNLMLSPLKLALGSISHHLRQPSRVCWLLWGKWAIIHLISHLIDFEGSHDWVKLKYFFFFFNPYDGQDWWFEIKNFIIGLVIHGIEFIMANVEVDTTQPILWTLMMWVFYWNKKL